MNNDLRHKQIYSEGKFWSSDTHLFELAIYASGGCQTLYVIEPYMQENFTTYVPVYNSGNTSGIFYMYVSSSDDSGYTWTGQTQLIHAHSAITFSGISTFQSIGIKEIIVYLYQNDDLWQIYRQNIVCICRPPDIYIVPGTLTIGGQSPGDIHITEGGIGAICYLGNNHSCSGGFSHIQMSLLSYRYGTASYSVGSISGEYAVPGFGRMYSPNTSTAGGTITVTPTVPGTEVECVFRIQTLDCETLYDNHGQGCNNSSGPWAVNNTYDYTVYVSG